MKRKIRRTWPAILCCCFLSLHAHGALPPVVVLEDVGIEDNRWSVTASTGYTEYQNMYHNDGHSVVARMAVAAELLATTQSSFGIEFGVQNGRSMRLGIPHGTLDVLGGVVRTTVKPMLDLLITANSNPVTESLLYTQVKGGIAYRRWQIASYLIDNKSELAGEVQAGFGYPITEVTSLNLLYQGVFGAAPKIRANPSMESWRLSNIPVQHGLLLGFSIIV
ncbi:MULTISPECIES: DUF3187 family protein [Legionella]|uniref:Outer membrane protein beta-barrel domain-containing protein n=1 Tax=Legionella donaldsonii TaxID=45060 RepID=A0A378J632_9GAMM|nr:MULTISPECIES: DUF3187 family protein [Legionella]MCC5014869.1 DUF3187 family protein [Legionella sp. 31fI33]STX42856.1 Uncharacterised protein [Legionella donaldsonii]